MHTRGEARRQLAGALAAVLFIAACATAATFESAPSPSASGPSPTPRPSRSPTPSPTVPSPTVAPSPPARPPTETPSPAAPSPTPGPIAGPTGRLGGIHTSTGVPVAVLAEVAGGLKVRTPCGVEAVVSGGMPIGPVDVVLDPGHGGSRDTGAIGPNGLVERELNLEVAKSARDELQRRGIRVALTRTGSYQSTLAARSKLADDLDARLLVSIHHNAPTWEPSPTPGTEVYFQHESFESKRAASLLVDHVRAGLARFDDVQWSSVGKDGLVQVLTPDGRDAYGMIRRPATTAVLAELGYLSNRSEAELFATSAYLRQMAISLADGIEAWLQTDQVGSDMDPWTRTFRPSPSSGNSTCTDPALD